jgi:hypothetical protein
VLSARTWSAVAESSAGGSVTMVVIVFSAALRYPCSKIEELCSAAAAVSDRLWEEGETTSKAKEDDSRRTRRGSKPITRDY